MLRSPTTFNPGADSSLHPLPQPQTPSRAAGSFIGPFAEVYSSSWDT